MSFHFRWPSQPKKPAACGLAHLMAPSSLALLLPFSGWRTAGLPPFSSAGGAQALPRPQSWNQLKQAQRERALTLGIQRITWTFDPLQSKNAHLNFAKLGTVSDRYKPDFYGPETSSLLHRNGTDRLWVTWP